MKYLASYLLLVVGGNASPSAEDVTGVITAAGGEVDEAKLEVLMKDLEGKSVEDLTALLAKGEADLKTVSVGGGGGAAPAAAAAAAPAAAKAPEKPKEEEVDPLAGGMDMFGSSGGGGGDY